MTDLFNPTKIKDQDHYVALQHMAGFNPGDKVRVVRAAGEGEGCWDNTWTDIMHAMVGKTYTIRYISGAYGVHLNTGYSFPFFVLEKIED